LIIEISALYNILLNQQVNWDDERKCFQTISAVLANFYAMHPPILPNPSGDGIRLYKKNREADLKTDILSDKSG
jgi:DNA mismatch repair protein Mlh1 C-terminus